MGVPDGPPMGGRRCECVSAGVSEGELPRKKTTVRDLATHPHPPVDSPGVTDMSGDLEVLCCADLSFCLHLPSPSRQPTAVRTRQHANFPPSVTRGSRGSALKASVERDRSIDTWQYLGTLVSRRRTPFSFPAAYR